ncbi:MAG: peptidylprolyl isomerase [Phycisphaerales bacterium]|nr:peptidylprolyl isomerase [Phycisphaerales bacterium]
MRNVPVASVIVPFLLGVTLTGCTTTSTQEPTARLASPSRTDSSVQPTFIASVDGSPLSFETIRDELLEAAGRVVVEEKALDVLLDQEMDRRGLSVTDEDIAYERSLMQQVLVDSATANRDDAERLLDRVLHARGIGPRRFESLLRRNAMLRQLVSSDIEIDEGQVRRTYDVAHGPRVQARIIVCASQQDASAIRRRLSTSSSLRVDFATEAMAHSTDDSAARGGLLDPIQISDPSYPSALREGLSRAKPEVILGPIALQGGFALVLHERDVDGTGQSFEDTAPAIRRLVRLDAERLAMQQLASRLISDHPVTARDPSLGWSLDRNGTSRR